MKRTLISAALLSSMAAPAFSGTMGEIPKMPWFAMLSGGPVWSASGEKQTISLQPGVVNTYQPDRNVSTFGTGSVFMGVDRDFWHGSKLQAGVAVTGSGPDVVRGGVWQDANPNFDNFEYTYRVSQIRLGLKGRVVGKNNHLFKKVEKIKPYGSGEIAVAWNRSYAYETIARIDTAVLQPNFDSYTKTALSYAFSAGLQGDVTDHVAMAVGYQITSWGNSNLGPANLQTTSTRLGLSSIYANEMQFSLIYTA